MAFSEAVLQDLHNADLADTLGNLVNRALMMCHKFSGGKIGDVPTECPFDLWDTVNKMEKHMAVYKLDFAVQAAVSAAHDCNKYLQESAPWAMKDPSQETQRSTVVRTALEGCGGTRAPGQPRHGVRVCEKVANPKVRWANPATRPRPANACARGRTM